jgi:hypothetical protein
MAIFDSLRVFCGLESYAEAPKIVRNLNVGHLLIPFSGERCFEPITKGQGS